MRILIAAVTLLLIASPAFTQNELLGAGRFPQFRGLSGLSGSGFGVDPKGKMSLGGAAAYSTPIAHVLGYGQWRIGYGFISEDDGFSLDIGEGNGTGLLMYGHSFTGWNVLISDIMLSSVGDHAINAQAQFLPATASRVNFSVGVQDIEGKGGAAGTGIPGDGDLSRSFFGVATFQATEGENPLWISAGIGSKRFRNGFVNASAQVAQPLRLWAEYDGLDPNFGVLLSFRSNAVRPVEVNLLIGVVKKYPTIALGLGF